MYYSGNMWTPSFTRLLIFGILFSLIVWLFVFRDGLEKVSDRHASLLSADATARLQNIPPCQITGLRYVSQGDQSDHFFPIDQSEAT